MAKKSKTQAPAPRDLGEEMSLISRYAQENAEAQAAQAVQTNQAFIDQALAATDRIAGNLNNSYTAAGRSSLDTAMRQVPQMDSLASRLGNVAGAAEADLGGTEIERQLNSQALGDLALGRSLSPEQVRESQQAARAGFAARGMAVGPGSAAAEILNRDAYATARQDARRAFAGSVNQMVSGNRLQRLGTAGNLLGQTAGVRQNAAQLGMQGAQGYIALDPYQRALGSNIPIASQGPSASMTSSAYGQVMNYGQDLYNTNYNAAWSNYLNRQNLGLAGRVGGSASSGAGNTAMYGAIGTGVGTVAGAAIGGAIGGVGAVPGAMIGGALGGVAGTAAGGMS